MGTAIHSNFLSEIEWVWVDKPSEILNCQWNRPIQVYRLGQLLDKGYISPEDLSFYKIVSSPEQALQYIKHYYSTNHSIRQVGSRLVIRLEKELSRRSMEELNDTFSDLLASGRISKTKPVAGEENEPELSKKLRICLKNNKKSAGRLNQLVLKINELGNTG